MMLGISLSWGSAERCVGLCAGSALSGLTGALEQDLPEACSSSSSLGIGGSSVGGGGGGSGEWRGVGLMQLLKRASKRKNGSSSAASAFGLDLSLAPLGSTGASLIPLASGNHRCSACSNLRTVSKSLPSQLILSKKL